MKDKNAEADCVGRALDLRQQAEAIALQREPALPNVLEPLSPPEIRQMIHELRVHQIQLEMQNDELRRTQAELGIARTRYFDLYELAPVGYCTVSETGLILEANLAASDLLGVPRRMLVNQSITRFIIPEDEEIYYRHRKRVFAANGLQVCELRMQKQNGTVLWIQLETTLSRDTDGAPVCRLVMSNISLHKLREEERELSAKLIALVFTADDLHEVMSPLTAALQRSTGCEAVGIRLRAGEDYPYYETRGFPPAFVEAEQTLCAYDAAGHILRDDCATPILECMCGNILCGRLDSSQPFFSAHGSFWSNNTTALPICAAPADHKSHVRNRCNREGYESVALIPLRAANEVLGLIQFNDHRPDLFTLEMITHFERLADNLAMALSRRKAEDALREHVATLERLNSVTIDRELCMIAMKKQINEILQKEGKPEAYRLPPS